MASLVVVVVVVISALGVLGVLVFRVVVVGGGGDGVFFLGLSRAIGGKLLRNGRRVDEEGWRHGLERERKTEETLEYFLRFSTRF